LQLSVMPSTCTWMAAAVCSRSASIL
jgi:hypothetical protein